ncbi:MAG: DHHA1 domain-containing protein [Nanoarchaeota archaeon]|nr:DHHA1 domain-containing protein [Nanoarchaeota archaeon]
MQKPEFIAGNELAFIDFMSRVRDGKGRIALVTHNDLDGMVAGKVANEVLKADFVKFVDYIDVNQYLVNELRELKVDFVVFTDLNIENSEIIKDISEFAEVLIIDHHRFSEDMNYDRITFLNAQGFCAGYLCYYLFSKVQSLESFDWLVVCSCLSDWLFVKNEGWIREVYRKHNEDFKIENNSFKKGRIWELQEDLSAAILYFRPNLKRVFDQLGKNFGQIGDLRKYSDEVKKEAKKALERFSKESIIIGGVYFWEISSKYPIKEIVVNILSMENPNTTFIVAEKRGNYYKISARRQNKNVDLPKLMKYLTQGFKNSSAGGHIPAAGANFPSEYYEEFKKRLRNLKLFTSFSVQSNI